MFKNILVPTDGSALSLCAIRQAVQFAREQKARVTGLHVVAPYEPELHEDALVRHYLTPQASARRARVAARKALQAIEKAAATRGVKYETFHTESRYPYDEIVRAAKRHKCDLIYMASHRRRGVSRLLLGSVTSKVLAHAGIPVLVCR